jgi:hypothetical protein
MTHLPMRLQPQHARSRRCQRAGTAGGRTGALRRLGPHAPSTGWTPFVTRHWRRCLHEPPPERRRLAQEATPCAGQRASCRCALRAGRSPSHRVASCAALRQRRTSRLRLRSRNHRAPGGAPALGPRFDGSGSHGAASARWGGRSFASAPAPAGAARCPAAAAPTHPPALPREGSESPSAVSGASHFACRHRPRRASSGTPPRQGRALRVASRPAWTRGSPQAATSSQAAEERERPLRD